MIIQYSYAMTSARRTKDKKGNEKVEATTFEVFIPALKSGTRTRGILDESQWRPGATGRIGKGAIESGRALEKEEEKIARSTPSTAAAAANVRTGMMPLGMYTHTTSNRSGFGIKTGSAALAIHTFLKTCELAWARRQQHDGRKTLVFTFTPRPDAQFNDNEKYIAQLNGEIWIDAQDRIVTRLVGWPAPGAVLTTTANPLSASGEKPPAVYVEMMRLPEGVWLPHVIRINAADYPGLFDGINTETISTFSNYIRFSSEIKDVKVGTPSP